MKLDAKSIKNFLSNNAITVMLVVLVMYVGLTKPGFFGGPNISNILSNVTPRLIIALGISGCLIIKGTDLSAGRAVGLGGVIANSVSEKLKQLSENHQVFAITHLSQLAVKADSHYLVYKEEVDGRTVSHIDRIEGEDRVKEIARLLSGETSEISLEHARSLLKVQ